MDGGGACRSNPSARGSDRSLEPSLPPPPTTAAAAARTSLQMAGSANARAVADAEPKTRTLAPNRGPRRIGRKPQHLQTTRGCTGRHRSLQTRVAQRSAATLRLLVQSSDGPPA